MIEYIAAEDEIFGVANVAWTEAVVAQSLAYTPQLVFPGSIKAEPPVDQIWAECGFVVVKESQASLTNVDGVSMYESIGLFSMQIYSGKADSAALRIAKQMGEAVRDAFRRLSPSGEVWFRDQRLTPVTGNTTQNQINVVVTCTYQTLK
jgi:hypothetical protein